MQSWKPRMRMVCRQNGARLPAPTPRGSSPIFTAGGISLGRRFLIQDSVIGWRPKEATRFSAIRGSARSSADTHVGRDLGSPARRFDAFRGACARGGRGGRTSTRGGYGARLAFVRPTVPRGGANDPTYRRLHSQTNQWIVLSPLLLPPAPSRAPEPTLKPV